MSQLPAGWAPSNLGVLTQTKSGNSKLIKGKLSAQPTGGAPFPAFSASGQDVWTSKPEHLGDAVIVSAVGARCGKAFLASGEWSAIANTHVVWPKSGLLNVRLLWYRINDESFWVKGGSAQPFVKVGATFESTFALPPANEQKRIADKLDTVLTRVDAVNTRLARVAPLLKRFRQSVLAAATSGRLTEDWRGDEKLIYPTLPMAEIADMRLGKMLDKAKNTGVPVRYLRNVNVRWFEFDLSDVLELRVEAHERDGLSIRNGDLLVCEGGEPGRCAVWTGGVTDLIFQKALHRVRPYPSVALSTWIAYVLKHLCDSGAVTAFFTGSTIKHLTGTALARVPIPVPNLDEQVEIVRRVETLFAFADRLEARLQTVQTATNRLTPSLLAKAFRGELVPQDPNDEPASELLKRLAAQEPTNKNKRTGEKIKSR